ncbi:MAG: aldolase catalytic domain-containing protein [Treponema sp.]|jgi:4-hydroxy 2-oxovalerate aldolase|nr:aldolase catalytic domain-containing protein [Treponema sp.]
MLNVDMCILDCTLRDGGYINDWKFGSWTIRSVVTRLDRAGIDIIECGFLDSRVEYNEDRSLYPDMPSIAKTLANSLPTRAMLVAMIDYGTFKRDLLIPKSESILDGIRLIFKKENIDEALDYAQEIKRLGYTLFLNPVALTSYRDMEILRLIDRINEIKPFGMSIVDTYGLMFDNDMKKYIYLIDSNLDPDTALGYHTHNNLQMGNAHCVSFIDWNLRRMKIVDSSILGMGKNAGNACTELVGSYIEKTGLKQLDVNHIFECAYTDILKFAVKSNWGYGLDNLLSAIHDCSPNWIKFFMNKHTLSIKSIRAILDSLPFEKREVSYFSKELAEQKYLDYMDKQVDDSKMREALREALMGREVILLCPGKTLKTHRNEIDEYISARHPIVITVNFIADAIPADYAFISNSIRYSQMMSMYSELKNKPQILLTSNIVPVDALKPNYTFNYKTLYENVRGDNVASLLITLLKSIGVGSIAIAGMDGFDESNGDESFFDANMRFDSSNNSNQLLIEQMRRIVGVADIHWITPSKIKAALYDNGCIVI